MGPSAALTGRVVLVAVADINAAGLEPNFPR